MWVQIVQILSNIFTQYIEGHLVLIIMSALGLSGGIWLWFVKFGVDQVVKKVEPIIDSAAHLQDQKIVDDKLNQTYQQDIGAKKDEQTLINDETNILNGGR